MRIQNRLKIVFVLLLQMLSSWLYSQNLPENLKVALAYNICKEIHWQNDTSTVFTIGILSTNQVLIDKFVQLSNSVKLNNKVIRPVVFSNEYLIKATNVLYIDQSFNTFFPAIQKKISKQNTLVISEEYLVPGEIMINIKFEPKTRAYTFEYNRANILFAGMEPTENIIALKGSEIEIRALYLQAKKLWDEQQSVVAALKKQSDLQNMNIAAQNDSIFQMKSIIDSNNLKIQRQILSLTQKDSISNALNTRINRQHSELQSSLSLTKKIMAERNAGETIIRSQDSTIEVQINLSESLTKSILKKQQELLDRNRELNEKENKIQRQGNWLIFSISISLIIISVILIVLRAYVLIKRSKQKIAEQKDELQNTLVQLQATQQQLIQSEKMASLGIFIAGIAHEINNPLNFISTGVEGLEKTIHKVEVLNNELNKLTKASQPEDIIRLLDLKDEIKFQRTMEASPKILENIKTGINRTVAITNGLRLYARMDKEDKCFYDINQVVETALLLVKPQINAQIAIEVNLGNLPELMIFPGKLSQVIVNILSNAIDAIKNADTSNEKPKIGIQTKIIKNTVFIEISDTGTGIPNEILTKLFDPFFTTKPVGKGTGLGMSISQSIVESHKGKIYATNNLEKGATFTIEIPANTD